MEKPIIPNLEFKNITFVFQFTEFCNWKCSYCNQGDDHSNRDTVSLNAFKLNLNKIIKELKKHKFEYITFSFLGGELSIDLKYLEYFEYFYKTISESSLVIESNFITNFTGTDEFFKGYEDIIKKYYPSVYHNYIITFHQEYYQTEKSIEKLFKKLEILTIGNIDLKILENPSESFQTFRKAFDAVYTPEKYKHIKHSIMWEGLTCRGIPRPGKVYCNALYYKINGKNISDVCKGTIFNFLNFKINTKPYLCNVQCPCIFLTHDFDQIPVKDL